MMTTKRAILYLTWGQEESDNVRNAVLESQLDGYDLFHISDVPVSDVPNLTPVQADFNDTPGHLKKCQIIDYLPEGYDSYAYLDNDTRVLDDISMAFWAAETYGLAMAPTPQYATEHYQHLHTVLKSYEVPHPHPLMYNTGVYFFSLTSEVRSLLDAWRNLAQDSPPITSDQILMHVLLAQHQINPYTLTTNYNCRGYDDFIIGPVAIWHSHHPVPEKLNELPYAAAFIRENSISPGIATPASNAGSSEPGTGSSAGIKFFESTDGGHFIRKHT